MTVTELLFIGAKLNDALIPLNKAIKEQQQDPQERKETSG